MQRLGNLNNKLIVESIYEPDNKNVIWKDTVNNEFKEYNGSGWVKSENLDTPKEEFPYEWFNLPPKTYVSTQYEILDNIALPDWLIKGAIFITIDRGNKTFSNSSNVSHITIVRNGYGPFYDLNMALEDCTIMGHQFNRGDVFSAESGTQTFIENTTIIKGKAII